MSQFKFTALLLLLSASVAYGQIDRLLPSQVPVHNDLDGFAASNHHAKTTSISEITGTKAQFDTAVTDGNITFDGDPPTAHNHVEVDVTDLTHFSPSAGISTNHGAGAVTATTDFAGTLCGTNQILEDQGASWACIATPVGSFINFDITDTDSTPVQTVDDGEQIQYAGAGEVTVALTPSASNHIVTITGSPHTTDTRVNIKEANIEEQADATDLDFDGTDFDVTCVAGECDVVVNNGGISIPVNQVTDLDDNAATLTLPANTTISAFGASLVDDADAPTARTTLGVDAAGTDNSTDVTLAGTPDYLTIAGQIITRGLIDLTTDVTGVLPDGNVADTITASNYLPLAGGTLTGELVLDETGLEGQPTDTLTDCSTFAATGGGLFYDDSEGKWKKCQDNVLTDLDTTGGTGNLTTKGDLEVYTTNQTRLPVGTDDYILTADSTAAAGVAWKPAPGAGSGTVMKVDSGSDLATADFQDGGDINFSESAGVVTGAVKPDTITYDKMQDTTTTDIFLGRDSVGGGTVEEISATAARTILNVEDGAAADQTITLTGDVAGSGTGSFAATIQPDSVALTTDTTGNYVQQVADGTGIDGSVNSEGGTYTPVLAVDELAEKTGALVGTDRLTGTSGLTNFSETISGIPLSIFNDDLTHTTDTRVNIKEANVEEQADATDLDFDGTDFDVTCVAGECDVVINNGGITITESQISDLSHFSPTDIDTDYPSEVVTTTWDFGGGTFEIPNGTALPGSCVVGQLFMDSDATPAGQQVYICSAVNTWSLVGDGGSGGGASVTISATAPGSPSTGDLWFDSVEMALEIYYNDGTNSFWVDAWPWREPGQGATQLSDLSDVTSAGVTNRFALMANGSAYVGRAIVEADISDLSHVTQLSDLSDVNTSTATNRNVLVADGVDFESRALVEADISDLAHRTGGRSLTLNVNALDADAELYRRTKDLTVETATTADDVYWEAEGALTLEELTCVATGSTTPSLHVVTVVECTNAGASCASSGLTITASALTTRYNDATPTDAAIDNQDFWGLETTSLTTAADLLHCTITYTVDD